MWLTDSEEVTWERFAEALEALEEIELAVKIRDKYCTTEEQTANGESKVVSKIHFFKLTSVHTDFDL